MSYQLVLDYIRSPFLVYDGCEPKKIDYELRDNRQVICMLDLWANAVPNWRESLSGGEISELDRLLEFPRKILIEEEEMVAHILDGPIYMARCNNYKEDREYLVYYTLLEIQPSRYQCYVFAVMRRNS